MILRVCRRAVTCGPTHKSAWQRRGTGPRPTPVLGWCLVGDDAPGVPRNPGEPNYRTPANPRFVRSALRQMITNCAFAREWHSIRCAMPGRRGRRPLRRDAANPRRGGYHPPARCGVKWMFRYSAHSQRTRFAVGATCGRPPVCSRFSANSPIYGIVFKSSGAARCGHRALQECRIVGDGVLDVPRIPGSFDCRSPANPQRTRSAVGATCGRPPVCSWISANSPIYGIAFKSSGAARCGHRAIILRRIRTIRSNSPPSFYCLTGSPAPARRTPAWRRTPPASCPTRRRAF